MSEPKRREEELFLAALEISDALQRAAYLKGACGKDTGLHAQLLELLAAHDATQGPLDRSPASAGDTLLQKATAILRQSVRLSDSVVRYGGDEFVITLKDVNLDMLTLIADQIRNRIHSELSVTEPERTITCSIGAAFYSPQQDTMARPDALIREADKAMSEARRRGGDRTIVSSLESGKWIAQTLTLQSFTAPSSS